MGCIRAPEMPALAEQVQNVQWRAFIKRQPSSTSRQRRFCMDTSARASGRQCSESVKVLPSILPASLQSCRPHPDGWLRTIDHATLFATIPFVTGEPPRKRKQSQFGSIIAVLPGVPPSQHAAADGTTTAAPVTNALSEITPMPVLV